MGVRGLENYLNNNPKAAYTVKIPELIRNFRKDFKCAPVIVVDGTCVMRHLYFLNKLSWLTGGQMKQFESSVKEFISAFQKEKAELVFYFDGPHIESKLSTKIQRRTNKIKEMYEVFNTIKNNRTFEQVEKRVLYFPDNTQFILKYVAKSCNCKVYNAVKECDLEIVEFAQRYNCMAILSQDTDFIIHRGAKYYFSMKYFKMDDMSTLSYDREGLASLLGISSNHLPLLASLLGNDIINTKRLYKFHEYIMKRKKNYAFSDLISNISKFISKIPADSLSIDCLKTLACQVFSDETQYKDLQNSILSYDPSAAISGLGNPTSSSNLEDNWSKIVRKVCDLHKQDLVSSTIYSIIIEKKYCCGVCMEDYRESDLPFSQEMLKPLRKKLYSILLHEFADKSEVEEWVVCDSKNLEKSTIVGFIKTEVNHPGLLSLWDGKCLEQQFSMICEIFNIDSSELKALPHTLIIPALSLRYLFETVNLEKNEMYSLASSAVLVESYNSSNNIQLHNNGSSTRPFRLYALLTKTYSLVLDLFNAVGNPVSPDEIKPSNYQDGNLFYLKYIEATKKNYSEIKLCNNNEYSFGRYKQVMSFAMKNNKSC